MSERIAGRTTLTLADQYASLFWSAPRAFRVGVIAGFAICGAFIAIELMRLRPNLIWIGVIAVFVISCFVMIALNHWKLSAAERQVEYFIDRERIVIRDGTGRAMMMPWEKVQALEEHGSGLVLKQGKGGSWLVKRAFSAADLAALKLLPGARHSSGASGGGATNEDRATGVARRQP
jgi:hypothetical protein